MNRDIKIARSGNTTDRQDEITAYPIEYEEISIFNLPGFTVPAVLVLIIQRTLLLGIGLAAGTARETTDLRILYLLIVTITGRYRLYDRKD